MASEPPAEWASEIASLRTKLAVVEGERAAQSEQMSSNHVQMSPLRRALVEIAPARGCNLVTRSWEKLWVSGTKPVCWS